MLRIRYAGRETVFHYKRIKKAEAAAVIANHLKHWGREQRPGEDGTPVTVTVPKDIVIAEWQDGETWREDGPVETLPIP